MPPISKKSFTSTDLGSISKTLRSYADEIERFAEEMNQSTVVALTVKGVAELGRADERIGIFCDNVRRELRRASRPKMFSQDGINGNTAKRAAAPRAQRGRPTKKKK